MFEGADRSTEQMSVRLAAQYVCEHCGNDRRSGPFSFLGRKVVIGCCRASVAERAGVSADQVRVTQSFLSDGE